MMGLALIGLLVMGSILGFGIYWLLTNITFKQVPEKYTHEGDKVIDNTDVLKKETK